MKFPLAVKLICNLCYPRFAVSSGDGGGGSSVGGVGHVAVGGDASYPSVTFDGIPVNDADYDKFDKQQDLLFNSSDFLATIDEHQQETNASGQKVVMRNQFNFNDLSETNAAERNRRINVVKSFRNRVIALGEEYLLQQILRDLWEHMGLKNAQASHDAKRVMLELSISELAGEVENGDHIYVLLKLHEFVYLSKDNTEFQTKALDQLAKEYPLASWNTNLSSEEHKGKKTQHCLINILNGAPVKMVHDLLARVCERVFKVSIRTRQVEASGVVEWKKVDLPVHLRRPRGQNFVWARYLKKFNADFYH